MKQRILNTVEELQKMWDIEANNGRPYPSGRSDIPSSSRVYWRCSKGHLWNTFFSARKRTGCPYCFGRFPIPGETDLKTTHPHLVKRWSPKNTIDMATVKMGTATKAIWVCEEGHEITRRISLMAIKFRCEVCESFGFLQPARSKLWHPTRNLNLTPYQVTLKSAKIVWWKCEEGHEWQARVFSQNISGCPACSGFKLVPGVVDIQTFKPWVIPYWSKKNPQNINDIHPNNTNLFYWDCKIQEHTWKGRIFNEPANGYNPCQICRNKIILPGFNDLATKAPHLAAEWHPTKNSRILTEISPFSGHKVWWICEKGHEWATKVTDRYSGKQTGCPECAANRFQSSAEKEIVSYLHKLVGEDKVKTQVRSVLKRQELDIYLPEHHVAIEYNGVYWHSEKAGKKKNYHYKKWLACQDRNINLIQVWEDQWLKNPALIIRIISQVLGKNISNESKKQVINLSNKQASTFFLLNSFNTKASGSIKLGLTSDNSEEVTAVVVLRTQQQGLSIVNFASTGAPVEDLKAFLSYVENVYNPDFVTAVTDNSTGESRFFDEAGFNKTGKSALNYRYSQNKTCISRKEYTIERFKDDPNLKFKEGLSEFELADLNGLNRIWDAGKTHWKRANK